MKVTFVYAGLVAAGGLAGMAIHGLQSSSLQAQGIPNAVPAPAEPRYQISAWSVGAPATPEAVRHGCYLVDTVTGELWHAGQDGKVTRISDRVKTSGRE